MRCILFSAVVSFSICPFVAAQSPSVDSLIQDRTSKLDPRLKQLYVDKQGGVSTFNSFDVMTLLNSDGTTTGLQLPGIDVDRKETLGKLVPILRKLADDDSINLRDTLLQRIKDDTHEVIEKLRATDRTKQVWENFRDKALGPIIGLMVLEEAKKENLTEANQVAKGQELLKSIVIAGMEAEIKRIEGFKPKVPTGSSSTRSTVSRSSARGTLSYPLYRYSKSYIEYEYKLRKLERELLLKRLK